MTEHDRIRSSLQSVRQELAETFPLLTAEMFNWAPADGMRTVSGQFVEILSTEAHVLDSIRGESRPFAEIEDPLKALTTFAALRARLDEQRAETLANLDRVDLAAPANVSPGFAKYLGLDSVPVGELFRFIARHESYHCGQLVSYLWSRGLNPYDW